MTALEAMQYRHSVRQYSPTPVEPDKLQRILEAVRLTPSRHNEQNIRVIAVQNPEVKRQICRQAETQPMVEQAGVLLVFCATGATDFIMPCGQYGYVVDMALATGFALVEAAEQGLDSCIVCAFQESAVKHILGIPAEARVVSMAVVGYGCDSAPRKEKKPLADIVGYDHF